MLKRNILNEKEERLVELRLQLPSINSIEHNEKNKVRNNVSEREEIANIAT